MKSFVRAALALSASCLALPAAAATTVVIVTSGNVTGAGTDSNIYIRLFDGDGQSRRLRVQDLDGAAGNMMESGDVDILRIADDGIDTAALRVQLESDGQYAGAAWHLDRIYTITYDETDPAAMVTASVIPTLMAVNAYDPAAFAGQPVHVSTFVHEDWVESDATFMAEGAMQNGVMLVRQEPVVQEVGGAETVETPIFVVYTADALDSAVAVPRVWDTRISRNQSFTVVAEDSQEGRFGASITAGYAPSDAVGGGYGEATVSAEYAFLTRDETERTWGTTVETTTSDTFQAEPGTLQFRILETRGVVANQVYQSLIQDETFRGLYIREASNFVPTGVTFTAGENGDEVWNRSVARAYAVSEGEGGYNAMIDRLRRFDILEAPMSYDQAMGG